MFRCVCLILGALSLLVSDVLALRENEEVAASILEDYDNRVAPEHTTVKVSLVPRRIVEFDINKSLLTMDAWFHMSWEDLRLAWDDNYEFENTTKLALPAESVWHPDITLYNSASGFVNYDRNVRVVANSDGSLIYIPPTQFKTYCTVDDDYDGSQNVTCSLKFGSWTYDGDQVDLEELDDGHDMSNFMNDGSDWDIVDVSCSRNVIVYSCCPEPYIDVTYYVTLHSNN